MNKNKITIRADGRNLEHEWTIAKAVRSMDDVCPSFEFHTTQKRPFKMSEWPIRMGGMAVVIIDGAIVLTGWIEDINISYTDTEHSGVIAGRGRTCDLVDCSRLHPNQWPNPVPMLTIVQDLLKPFGINAVIDSSAGSAVNQVIKPFALSAGSTVMEGILKLAKLVGVMVNTDVNGDLLFTGVGTVSASDILRSGVNILSGEVIHNNRDRFSEYYAKGYGYGVDQETDYANIDPIVVRDTLMERPRPYVFMTETETDKGKTETRALWEASYRAGNSRQYRYTVQGFHQRGGKIWEPNMLIQVEDDVLDVHEQLIINSVEYSQYPEEPGTTTTLQVCSPLKYAAQAALDQIKTKFDE